MQARLDRMMAFLKMRALERKCYTRFDRWCHGGVVTFRLPLRFRVEAANGTIEYDLASQSREGAK
jgi:hypothetical protein